ncbi:hypothetical protein AB0O68_01640 [Streptomyces sp. NPDC087512]|uniref:hypothetical protein n=1 Tax=Streptomyces sp. NPDC087512 TaxID=3155059 RepID=UPI00342AB475
MRLEKTPYGGSPGEPVRQSEAEGCLTVAIRIPVRIVALVVVVPVRLAWDALVVAGRFLRDTVLRPLGRVLFVWPAVGVWRYVLVPLGRGAAWLGNVLLVVPAVWLYRWVLTPVGHALTWAALGIGAGLAAAGRGLYAAGAWLGRYLVALPAAWLYRWVLTPVGHVLARCGRGLAWCARAVARGLAAVVAGVGTALYWTARILLVIPSVALWRWVLAPVGRGLAVVGREIGDALAHAWRIAGHLSLAVGRGVAAVLRWLVADPARWVYRTLLTPAGHLVRDVLWRPLAEASRGAGRAVRRALDAARLSARQARADVRRALFGEPAGKQAVARGEPSAAEARTLGSSTTALTKD